MIDILDALNQAIDEGKIRELKEKLGFKEDWAIDGLSYDRIYDTPLEDRAAFEKVKNES